MIRVAAVRMGNGHLRAALPLARALGVPLERADQPPLATPAEARAWAWLTEAYEALSRRAAGGDHLARALLARITAIPEGAGPHPPDLPTRTLGRLLDLGLGRGLAEALRGDRLLTTFYSPALAADRAGVEAWCVVTDSDCARAWVGERPGGVHYLAPVPEVAERLRSHGVDAAHVHLSGFPLPAGLVAGAEAALERRGRGDPLHLVLAVGGAGTQVETVRAAIRESAGAGVRLTVVVGTRVALAEALRALAAAVGAPARIEVAGDFATHADQLEAALADADLLWTKPSELSFYAALGLPLALAAPVGVQEERNAAWLARHDAALDAPETGLCGWALARREALAETARRAFRLPRGGTAGIVARLRAG